MTDNCANCDEPGADAYLFGIRLCPNCYTAMAEPEGQP